MTGFFNQQFFGVLLAQRQRRHPGHVDHGTEGDLHGNRHAGQVNAIGRKSGGRPGIMKIRERHLARPVHLAPGRRGRSEWQIVVLDYAGQ